MAVQIRPATPADEPFLWEMLYHAIYVPVGNPPPPRGILSEPHLSRYVREWGQPDNLGYLAWDKEKPVGAV